MKRITKGIAFLLCISMLFGLCPSSAYATGSDTVSEPVEEQVLDQIQEPAEEQVLNQVQEQPEETIVELGWTTCQYWEGEELHDSQDLVMASGKGIERVSAIWTDAYDEMLIDIYGSEWNFSVYEVFVEGYTQGDTLTLSFELPSFGEGNDSLKLYRIDEAEGDSIAVELPIQEVTTSQDEVLMRVTFDTTKTGVFAIGSVQEPVEEPQTGELIIKELPTKLVYQLGENFDASGLEVVCVENGVEIPLSEEEYTVTADLSKNGQQTVTVSYGTLSASFDIWVCDPKKPINVGIAVKELPAKTEYVAGETFDDKGLKVVMYYDNGKEEEISTYYLSEADTMTPGLNPVTVTSGSHTTVFYITVKEPQPEPVDEEMTVTLEDNSKLKVKIKTSAFNNVTYKITDVHNYIWVNTLLSEVFDGDFVALDIQPDENFIPGEKTTVTLPLPDHIASPVVYCVTEKDGIVERIVDVTVEDGMVSFVTDHFSVYAIGEGVSGEDSDPIIISETAWWPLSGTIEDKHILILNTDDEGPAHAMASNGNSVIDEEVTILSGEEGVYIPDNVPSTAVWRPEKSGSQWKFRGYQDKYLNTNDENYDHSFGIVNSANDARAFVFSNNGVIQYTYRYLVFFSSEYYIKYGDQWELTTDLSKLYLFESKTTHKSYDLVLKHKVDNVESTGAYTYKGAEEGNTLALTYSGVPAGGTISYESLNPEIASVENETVILTGEEGQTIIQATYNWEGYTSKAYFVLFTEKPVYEIDILDDKNQSITNIVSIKNVSTDPAYPTTRQLNAKLTKDEVVIDINTEHITWESSDESIAVVDEKTGMVTFTGKEGSVRVTVLYTYADGSSVTDTVTFTVKQDDVIIPSDGTNDFPEYPNEGSIRFDKHATAVGNFSDTGVVQVELSMTGVPYTEGSEIDVVMMLDMSTSINDPDNPTPKRYAAAITAAQEALGILVKNEDGTFNGNRVAIYGFNGWHNNDIRDSVYNEKYIEDVYDYFSDGENTPNTKNYNISKISDMQTYDSETYTTTFNNIKEQYTLGGGTNYAAALRQCYLTLEKTKEEGRKQYVIFMTDGFASTGFAYQTGDDEYAVYNTSQLGTDGLKGIQNLGLDKQEEYYSTLMKENGVEIFSVGLQVGDGVTTDKNEINAGKTVLKNIAGTSDGNANMAGYENYAMFVNADDDPSKIVEIFKTITQSIKQAATNVVVTDKIADEYTMIFELPDGHEGDGGHDTDIDLPDGQELYIEVLDYQLKAVTDANGTIVDYARGESKSLAKIYLCRDTDKNFYAAVKKEEDTELTAADAPVFEEVVEGEKGYWKPLDSSNYDIKVGDQYYKFMPKGDGTHNMKSGAYASGTENGNLKIASPYFFYDASTRMLVWTTEKLSETELALSYFLYLDESAGCEGKDHQRLPGTYETNDYATLRYTNHLGNDCEQEFPIPQMTWNGAQVSYVFYLVNDQGQPVNRAGRVIPFSEAVYITDVFTESIVWNEADKTDRLIADMLAEKLVPDIYSLYDQGAAYTIHVFENENKSDLNNHFKIESSYSVVNKNTTYVFNTKSDAVKYTVPGIYSKGDEFLCKDYDNVEYKDGQYSYNGNGGKQYLKDGKQPIYGKEVIDGQTRYYTIVYKATDKSVNDGFDFANTTVAFAVTWNRELKPDTVVIDYGLDTVIDVAYNDGVLGTVVGVRTDQHSPGLDGDSSTCEATKYQTADVYLNNINEDNFKIGTATVENNTSVRFSLDKENGMQMKDWARFYYEYTMTYFNADGELEDQDMYTSVTVIPATTIYYEDEYVTLSDNWTTPSQTVTKIQQVDRPGPDKVAALYDADNEYGSDAAYLQCSKTSMDNSAMIRVGTGESGTAEFEFYGTGFDIISATSHRTGTIVVQVTDSDNKTKNYVVDTYYGYQYQENLKEDYNHDGKLDENDRWILIDSDQKEKDNSLWQIPVMKIAGLDYGHYKVKIKVSYSGFFDHNQYGGSGYDFYLDAIRIYDPAGRENANQVIKDAYIADREYLPEYYELRNMVIEAGTFDAISEEDEITGIVFIDGKAEVTTEDISNYVSYGPNNELYLAPGQSVVFDLNAQREDEQAVDMVQLAWKSVGGTAKAKIWSPEKNASSVEEISVKTATDMYFDITDLNGGTVIIQNTGELGDSILSITNIKVTAKEEPAATQELAMFSVSRAAVQQALLSLNNEIPEPEPPKKEEPNPVPESPTPEPPKKEESTPTPDKPVQDKPTPEAPKVEVETLAPEAPKTEVETPAPESPKTETGTPVPEAPKTEVETPTQKPSEPKGDNQVSDDLENQESETEKPEETKKEGIISMLIEFIKMLVRSILDWFSRWF